MITIKEKKISNLFQNAAKDAKQYILDHAKCNDQSIILVPIDIINDAVSAGVST